MIELGKKQKLLVVKIVEFGIYLAENKEADAKNRVLLPAKQVPQGTKEGDRLEVFIYKDSQDRLIATTREPALTVGQTALLKVRQVTRIGAFLDWGLEKDLLLPYHEQTVRVREGQECLVALYVDKSSRLCATMKVYPYLLKKSPYQAGDQVRGRIYQISDNFGVFEMCIRDSHYIAPSGVYKNDNRKYRINSNPPYGFAQSAPELPAPLFLPEAVWDLRVQPQRAGLYLQADLE